MTFCSHTYVCTKGTYTYGNTSYIEILDTDTRNIEMHRIRLSLENKFYFIKGILAVYVDFHRDSC